MAGKDITVKKYVVRLSGEEREQLQALVRKGKPPARRLLKALILLKADVSEGGPGWSDIKIIALWLPLPQPHAGTAAVFVEHVLASRSSDGA
jgi:hypothetical protein